MNIFKWLTIPSGGTEQIKAYEKWTVRWTARQGKWHNDTRPECEVFTTEEDARKFAAALKAAFRIIKNTAEEAKSVEVEKG